MTARPNFMVTQAITADPVYEFASEVRAGLTRPGQRELPSKYLYDDVGSALFEVISVLPQYGLTRADERLLQRYAHEMVERLPAPVIVAELGSTIGNFDRPAAAKFLRSVREILNPGDSLLLGTDLEKPIPQLIEAYDDPLGVTAAFNVNLLARINRELDGDFVLDQWKHEARFNPDARSMEMHLRSKQNQVVAISRAELSLEFSQGETIWTESSHKYATREPFRIAREAGFRCVAQWVDREWPFAENLFIAE